jgi:hypothetical protein
MFTRDWKPIDTKKGCSTIQSPEFVVQAELEYDYCSESCYRFDAPAVGATSIGAAGDGNAWFAQRNHKHQWPAASAA